MAKVLGGRQTVPVEEIVLRPSVSSGGPSARAGAARGVTRKAEVLAEIKRLKRAATSSEIHDRMPVVLPSNMYSPWLDPPMRDAEPIQSLPVA